MQNERKSNSKGAYSAMISIVIPIYNEEGNILQLCIELQNAVEGYSEDIEVLFVDDGSSDQSYARICTAMTHNSSIKVIRLKKRYGQDVALFAGFENACGDIIISMDGDLQDDPNDIKLLLAKIEEGYDIVCGWRKKRDGQSILRMLIAGVGNNVGRLLFGLAIHDFNATFKAYKRTVIQDFVFFKGYHRFIPVFAKINGYKIAEVVIKNNLRHKGRSQYVFGGLSRVIPVIRYGILLKIAIVFRLDFLQYRKVYSPSVVIPAEAGIQEK